VKIAPSVISLNLANLKEEVSCLEDAGADLLHIDIMDGNFVPNITFGPNIVRTIRSISKIPLDVHLMIKEVDNFIPIFAGEGADFITIHAESAIHLHRSINLIKNYGVKAGLALNPATPPDILDYILNDLDLVLAMTVNPGFSGQQFILSQLAKIAIISSKIEKSGRTIELEVDGGIDNTNCASLAALGATILVSGSYLTGQGSGCYKERIAYLKKG
jgi:ribulose-phosphate 3-epimerase